MAVRARANGDPVELWTNQAYGEWKPDYDGQMEFGMIRNLPSYPNDDGWGYFINRSTGRLSGDPTSRAKSDFAAFMGKLSGGVAGGSLDCDTSFPETALSATGLKCGLVIMHEQDSAIVRIGFRASMLVQTMLSAPMFYTEAKFQGVDE